MGARLSEAFVGPARTLILREEPHEGCEQRGNRP